MPSKFKRLVLGNRMNFSNLQINLEGVHWPRLARAPATSTPMTDELAQDIRDYAEANPGTSHQEIAEVFNVKSAILSAKLLAGSGRRFSPPNQLALITRMNSINRSQCSRTIMRQFAYVSRDRTILHAKYVSRGDVPKDRGEGQPRRFPTPPWATRGLVEHVLENKDALAGMTCWEPACGAGHMSKVLKTYFLEVRSSDAYDCRYGEIVDFVTMSNHKESVDWIITNPPFRHADCIAGP